jgi:release factor glutamine methyltransferase
LELGEAGVDSARTDAELLAAHVLGTSRGGLALTTDLTADQEARYLELVAQRASRVPLQHLTGTAGFRYLELEVGPGVFVPRPETELLVGWGLETLAATGLDQPVVVDLCSGSGAIALAVAQECPDATVYAVELSVHAVAWARRNLAARSQAGDRPITLLQADATDPAVLAELDATADLVLTNPPYVPDGAVVAREAAEHDPPEALWGGPDGLDVVRALVRRAAKLLRPGGWIGIEHADLQGAEVPALLAATRQWGQITDHRDLAGRDRFTTARKEFDA